MNKPISIPPRGSLLERAEGLFDLNAALRGAGLPPIAVDAPLPQVPVAPPAPAGVDPVTPTFDAAVPPVAHQAAPQPHTVPQAVVRAPDWRGPIQPLNRAHMAEQGFLVPDGAVSGLSEEFRILKRDLRARLRVETEAAPAQNGHTLLITSAHSGDGKTFCAVNLAVSMAAETDAEVLLIDADFARPSVVSGLGVQGGPGLMDVLADPRIAVESCVIPTDVPSLFVLPTGQSTNRDSEFLASSRMRDLLTRLLIGRPDRIVIFDSPPLLAASPAAVLSTLVDDTILVVRADRTSEAALRDAAHLLSGCPRVRLLLNGVRFSASGRRFGSYYGKGNS